VRSARRSRSGLLSATDARVEARVRELAASYTPPSFHEAPGPDAALFLTAIDHRSGYLRSHEVGEEGPFEGSELLWRLGALAERREPGLLSAARLRDADAATVERIFRAEDETVSGATGRAEFWRDLAAGLERYDGSAAALLAACEGRLGGEGGLLARLAGFEAFSDPLQKKAFLFAKIAERRGWLHVSDPESWEVCADNVLMRLALRSGLVEQGGRDEVRSATRSAFRRVADRTGVSPPVLDDLLWELGRDDPDLLGTGAGDLREPDRDPDSHWY
jgi:hypothetical protein